MPGDHEDGGVRPVLPDIGQQRETVHPWQLDVGDDSVVVPGGDLLKRNCRRVGCVHRHLTHSKSERFGERLQQGEVVIDDEYAAWVHDSPLAGGTRGRTIRKVAPSPGGLTTEIVPPCSLIIP